MTEENDSTTSNASLYDYQTGGYLREATDEELQASRDAGPEGVIEVDGRSVYVQE